MKSILKIFLVLASLLFVLPSLAQALPQGDLAELRQTQSGIVSQVISPSTLQLQSGEIIRLSGLYYPDYSEDNPGVFSVLAVKILKDMLEGKKVEVYQTRNSALGRTNRMGHSLAHLVRLDDQAWVQGSLLELGLALVQTDQANPEMAEQMLKIETQAREEKIGLWEDTIHILTPEEAVDHIGEFAIVEGRIESVAMKSNRLFLNFGKNWKDDFTVTVAPENRRNFNKGGINPLDWKQETIRVRGVLSELNGPNMEIDTPSAVEKTAAAPPEKSQESLAEDAEERGNVLPPPLPIRK